MFLYTSSMENGRGIRLQMNRYEGLRILYKLFFDQHGASSFWNRRIPDENFRKLLPPHLTDKRNLSLQSIPHLHHGISKIFIFSVHNLFIPFTWYSFFFPIRINFRSVSCSLRKSRSRSWRRVWLWIRALSLPTMLQPSNLPILQFIYGLSKPCKWVRRSWILHRKLTNLLWRQEITRRCFMCWRSI